MLLQDLHLVAPTLQKKRWTRRTASDTPWFFLIWSGPFANAGKVPLSLQFAWHLAGAGPFFSPWRFDRTNIEVFGQRKTNTHEFTWDNDFWSIHQACPNICRISAVRFFWAFAPWAPRKQIRETWWSDAGAMKSNGCAVSLGACFEVFCNETDLWWPIQVIWWYCPIGIHLSVIWFTYYDLSSVQTSTDPGGQILMILSSRIARSLATGSLTIRTQNGWRRRSRASWIMALRGRRNASDHGLEITTCHELHQGHLEGSFQVYYEWRA